MNKYEFITSNKNDKFSYFRGIDLQELLVEIENFYLIYRKSLDLPNDVSFGVEIEHENAIRVITDMYMSKHYPDWKVSIDFSLINGSEVISPILTDNKKSWEELKGICDYLKQRKVNTLNNAGGHIHIGAHVLDDMDKFKKFIKMYIAFEPLLFRFLYGDKISARKNLKEYASSTSSLLFDNLNDINSSKNIEELFNFLPKTGKFKALNFENVIFSDITNKKVKNTIEFRSPNATIEEVIWQNNINLLTKLILSSTKDLDLEYLNYKIDERAKEGLNDDIYYNEINLKSALEFVDIIFDNNIDKIYFLRQYLKCFQNNYGIEMAVKSKKFYK